MFHGQNFLRQNCSLLAVLCGEYANGGKKDANNKHLYPFPELISSGRLEVHTLTNPTKDKFTEAFKSLEPTVLYLQGARQENEDSIGSLVWGAVDVSEPEILCTLINPISPPSPTIVYLEVPDSFRLAQALLLKGVPYIIFWKNFFSCYAASHFRHALFSVIQSSCSHAWDAFQLASASFRLYCVRNNHVSPGTLGPCLLGDAPKVKINIPPQDVVAGVESESLTSETTPAIKIYDVEMDVKFLVCGVPCTLDACLLGSLEDGLNALLNIEVRGCKLQNRVSAPPPPLQAGSFSRGVVTMRCDVTTCSSAHISLLVSGSAQACFDDQLLESHIKSELIEKGPLVRALPKCEEGKPPFSDPSRYISIASSASVFEVPAKVPTWAAQVLRQLAPDYSYRSLSALGIASVRGVPVASFDKEDADRLLFFCARTPNDRREIVVVNAIPSWSSPLINNRSLVCSEAKPEIGASQHGSMNHRYDGKEIKLIEGRRLKVLALRPIPNSRPRKMLPFSRRSEFETCDGNTVKTNLLSVPAPKNNYVPPTPVTHRKSSSSSLHAHQLITLNPLPMKKHGCIRSPIQVCSEEEFLNDVMQFLIHRGHNRLVPQGGISEFPDAILNAKRLDLYNLYREVVSRGGFYVGNGINWKGQVFPKMRNHTLTNRMTGVGNTLKRHYETYLLEYELAHDDVDGECCLLCHSSAPGDWVNCGLCGEWAHFGCDRRQGLGTFKDYAKTDGLEYVCPHCSVSGNRRKSPKVANGFAASSQF